MIIGMQSCFHLQNACDACVTHEQVKVKKQMGQCKCKIEKKRWLAYEIVSYFGYIKIGKEMECRVVRRKKRSRLKPREK